MCWSRGRLRGGTGVQEVTSISQPVEGTEHGFLEKPFTKIDSPVLFNESTESIVSDHTNVNFITNIPPPNTHAAITQYHITHFDAALSFID